MGFVKQFYIKDLIGEYINTKYQHDIENKIFEEKRIYKVHKVRVGTVALFKKADGYYIGWSICAPEDRFSKVEALKFAANRQWSVTKILEEGVYSFIDKMPSCYKDQAVENIGDLLKEAVYDTSK